MTSAVQHTTTRRLTAWLVALAVMLAPLAVPRALAQDAALAQARQHYLEGKRLFDAGDYPGAIRAFEAADRIAPSPILHFNIGLAHERLGNQDEALRRYRAYLQEMPQAGNRSWVEARIQHLEADLRAAQGPVLRPGAHGAPVPAPGIAPVPPAAPAPQGMPGAQVSPAPVPPAPDGVPGAQVSPAPAGDPLLERVATIDVALVRDQRAETMRMAETSARAGDGAPAGDDGQQEATPAHKQVWFWAVAGVSALILLRIVTAGGSDTRALSSGPALLRF